MTRPSRVLVVDDNLDTQKVIADLLQDGGCEATLASNGSEAIRLFKARDDIDLVLADIVMPSISGFELARQLKSLQPKTPVLLMTGYAAYVDAISQIGAVPLLKPFTASVLLRVVGESLGRHEPPPGAAVEAH